jgi:pimeloyl-ACP methyl ester carboxylesterase
MRGRALALALLLLLPGGAVSAQPDQEATPEAAAIFAPAACPFTLPAPEEEGVTYSCGYVTVPIDHGNPGGATIDLAVAVLHATGDDPAGDPILWLEGGPGASALIVADTNRKITAEARERRDVILLDQRGAGYSGYLECGSYQSAAAHQAAVQGTPLPEPPGPDAGIFAVYEYAERTAALGYAECRAGYAEQGIDLAHFTTEAIAQDAMLVLDALGYEQATLWGTSYGGRIATAIMRSFPERVRAAVLDSPLPIGLRRLAHFTELETEPAEHLFAWCAADRECAEAYPDLETRTIALVDRLNSAPVLVSGEQARRAGLRDGIDGGAVVRLLTAVLPGNPLAAGAIPRAIADLERGDPEVAVALLAGEYPPPVEREIPPSLTETSFDTLIEPTDARYALSLAMRTVVFCNDEAGDVRLADIVEAEAGAGLDQLRTQTPFRSAVTLLAQCHALDTGVPPLDTSQPAAAIPTLVLAGDYDATTAPSWAEDAASALPGAEFVAVPSASHATARWSACARAIITAFVSDPEAAIDRGCLADEQPVALLPGEPLG